MVEQKQDNRLHKAIATDPMVYTLYKHFQMGEMTYEEFLRESVVQLARQKKELTDQIVEQKALRVDQRLLIHDVGPELRDMKTRKEES